jgi:hypothetical protein
MGRRTKEEKPHWHVTPLRRNSDMRGVWVNHIAINYNALRDILAMLDYLPWSNSPA